MKTAIFVNGEIQNYEFIRQLNYDYIIACDGGLRHCHRLHIMPNYIVGDLDSAPPEILKYYQNIPVLKFPSEKDFTDLELAIAHAREAGATSLEILGGFGGRFDHQLANVHVLAQAKLPAIMRDESTRLQVLSDSCSLNVEDGVLVSLIPLTSTVEGVTSAGLKYTLNEASLSVGYAIGVSNEIVKESADIYLKKGMLLVIQIKEKKSGEV